jgi:hypothetical protein
MSLLRHLDREVQLEQAVIEASAYLKTTLTSK